MDSEGNYFNENFKPLKGSELMKEETKAETVITDQAPQVSAPEKYDAVYAPQHYIEGREIEPIDVIEDWQLDFHLAQVVKYVARAGRKDDAVIDLEKAMWYLSRKLATMRVK